MNSSSARDRDLNEVIDRKITSLIREMEEADWRTDEVVLAIDSALRTRWMVRLESLQEARAATSGNFVSDGNEG